MKVQIIDVMTEYGRRYIIIDPATASVIDNAQGYGFKTASKAEAYANRQCLYVINQNIIDSKPLF